MDLKDIKDKVNYNISLVITFNILVSTSYTNFLRVSDPSKATQNYPELFNTITLTYGLISIGITLCYIFIEVVSSYESKLVQYPLSKFDFKILRQFDFVLHIFNGFLFFDLLSTTFLICYGLGFLNISQDFFKEITKRVVFDVPVINIATITAFIIIFLLFMMSVFINHLKKEVIYCFRMFLWK